MIGAGGIGFDVSEYLATHKGHSTALDIPSFMDEWGVDMEHTTPGSLKTAAPEPSPREIYLIKRSKGKHGKNLGKTTGWIHRSSLKMKNVSMIANATYQRIDDQGLHIEIDGNSKVLEVDHVVICAGQESLRELELPLREAGMNVHLIGGAHEAAELDAKRAIDQAARLVVTL